MNCPCCHGRGFVHIGAVTALAADARAPDIPAQGHVICEICSGIGVVACCSGERADQAEHNEQPDAA